MEAESEASASASLALVSSNLLSISAKALRKATSTSERAVFSVCATGLSG